MYRQGDVLIVPVPTLPATAVRQDGPAILAYGEVTGHAHTVDRGILWQAENATYLTVEELTEVRHQEHAAIPLAPGTYQIVRQREWTDEHEPRVVAD
jgi:hypothetical protein